MNDFATGKNVTALPDGLSTFTWDTKVKDLLPGEFELPDKWATEKVSVRDFLLHSSGMGRYYYFLLDFERGLIVFQS
jgi:CubicO group peptidase (beta-lactamase class C family)